MVKAVILQTFMELSLGNCLFNIASALWIVVFLYIKNSREGRKIGWKFIISVVVSKGGWDSSSVVM